MANNESRVIITADAAPGVREFGRFRVQATSTLKEVASYGDKVGAVLGAIGLTTGLAGIVSMSDEFKKYTSQLKLATVSQNEYNAAYADVKRIANNAQQSLAGTGTLYARIANGTRELGTTQKEVAAITETVNLALMVSGATATESASAQLQLSQAFASGTLRGEEFNAVNEAAPRLMKALADGMGLPIGALKGMAGEGKITSKIMAEVLPQALEKLREEGKQISTIGGALTVLKNEFMEFTAVKAEANGTVGLLTGSIKLLSDNLNVLFAVTAGLTTLKLAGYFFTGVAAVQAYFAANAELAALVVVEKAALVSKAQALVATTTASAAATAAALAESEATLAGLVVQRGSIIAIREGAVAQLALARTNIVAAETAIAAATAAGAQSYALRIVRLATAELAAADIARAAAMAEITALGIAETRVLAQIAASTAAVTAASAANTTTTAAQAAAHAGLNGALGRTAITASLGVRALGFLGGPIGIITTLLTAGAAAWVLWSGRAKDESAKAAAAVVESSMDMIARLKEENAELDRRNRLRTEVPIAKSAPDPQIDALAKAKKEMEDAGRGVGRFSGLSAKRGAEMLANRTANYLELEKAIVENQAKLTRKAEGTRDDQIKAWRAKNGSAQEQMEAELAELRTKFGTIPDDIEIKVRAKYEDKSVAAALNKEKTAYDNLIASIRTKIAENTLEAKTDQNASESQKMRIKLDEVLGTGKRALSAAHRELAKDAIAELAATEAALKAREQEKDVQDSLLESTTARAASTAALAAEYAMYGKSSDARALEMIAVKAQADQEKYLVDAKIKGHIVTGDQIKALTAEKDARVLVEQATLAQTAALNYAAELDLENRKFAIESIADPKARADAQLEDEANIWRKRIELTGAGTEAQKLLQTKFNTWYANQSIKVVLDVDVTRATEVLNILESMDAAARSAASGMADSFGSVGTAIGGLTTALSGYAVQQQAVAAQLAASIGDAKGDPTKIAQAQAIAARQGAQAQVKSYGDMASAAKGFFKENSTGYKVMQTTEKAFRAYEMAMAVESMVKKIFFKETEVAANLTLNATKLTGEAATTAASTGLAATEASAWGITAVVKALASLPFPLNLAAGAATLAAVVAIGAKLMGGMGGSSVSLSEQRQAANGTGSILGNSSAKSESIAHSLAIMEKNSGLGLAHTISMDSSLKQMVSGIGNLSGLLARDGVTAAGGGAAAGVQTGTKVLGGTLGTVTGTVAGGVGGAALGTYLGMGMAAIGGPLGLAIGAVLGSVLGGVVSKLFNTSTSIKDQGITGKAMSLGDVDALGFTAQAYADINTKKKAFGISYSSKNSTQTAALSDEMNDQFSMIISSMGNTIRSAADVLGLGGAAFNAHLNSFVVDLGKISLKDLSGEEQQKELETAFSKLGDDMAKFGVAGLQQYQAVGEGYLETLVRVTNDYMQVSDVLAVLGKSFNVTGLGAVALSESLITAAGGLDKLTSGTSYFVENFLTEAERMAPITKSVNDAMGKLGVSGVTTVDQFKALVLAQDLNTSAGQAMYAQLIALAEPFKTVADYAAELAGGLADVAKTASEIASERKDLQSQLDQLTLTSIQLREKERAGLDASNRSLYDQVQAATAVAAARDVLSTAYDRESSAITATIDKTKAAAAALRTSLAGMLTGDLSPLSDASRLAVLRSQMATATPDTVAASSNAYLQLLKTQSGSALEYARGFASAQQAIEAAALAADAEGSIAQQQLTAMDKSVAGIIDINKSVISLHDALAAYAAAGGIATPTAGDAVQVVNFNAPVSNTSASQSQASAAAGAEVVAELKLLRDEVKFLRAAVVRGADGAVKSAELLDSVSGGGGAFLVEMEPA